MFDYARNFTVLLFLVFYIVFVTTDTVPEFQFPCYVDVCTFPRQFCNSDRHERRCSPCTRSLCKEKELPRACLYFCQVADQPKVTTTSPVKDATQSQWQDNSTVYMVYMIVFIAISNTAIFITVIFYVLWTLQHRRKQRRRQFSPIGRFISQQDCEEPLLCKKKETRRCASELELRRLESFQSLPPYCTREEKVVDIPGRSAKLTDSIKTDNQSASVNTNSKQSIALQVEVDETRSSAFTSFVSSPTGDSKSECHEKPWPKGTLSNKRFDSSEPALNSTTDEEETVLKV